MQYARALQQLIVRYERKYLEVRSSTRLELAPAEIPVIEAISKRAGSILKALSRKSRKEKGRKIETNTLSWQKKRSIVTSPPRRKSILKNTSSSNFRAIMLTVIQVTGEFPLWYNKQFLWVLISACRKRFKSGTDKPPPTHSIVQKHKVVQYKFALMWKPFSLFPRLWTHGTQDGPRKNILYDLRGGWNSAGFDNVSVNWWAFEHVFSPFVSTGEEETRYEEHRGLKHG